MKTLSAGLRAHVLGIVLFGAVVPLTVIGVILTRSAVRSGHELLDRQLTGSLDAFESAIAARWRYRRGDLLLLSENDVARHVLAGRVISAADSAYLEQLAAAVGREIVGFRYVDPQGRPVYASEPPRDSRMNDQAAASGALIRLRYAVRHAEVDRIVGAMEADVRLDAVIPHDSMHLLPRGGRLALRDRSRDAVLVRLDREVPFPAPGTTPIEGEAWLASVRRIPEPPFDLAVAAPLAPWISPFERAGRIGLLAVTIVAISALLLSAMLTLRLARIVGDLADAADAVATGDLTRQAREQGPREVRRLATSFNLMTESLRRVLAELSERRALAAVGEFATELSHEVRNALSSVQIDLQRIDERSEDAKNRTMIARTRSHVRRLDAAVSGALRVARSGILRPAPVQLLAVVAEAVGLARPSYDQAGTSIVFEQTDDDTTVNGDGDALRQLFLNLLLNAQQSLDDARGETRVFIRHDDARATVSIMDTGRGMDEDVRRSALEPFFTTRPGGTGLGLSIARQIAVAHGGDLAILSIPGAGTTVEVTIPAAHCRDPAGRAPGRSGRDPGPRP